MLEFCSYNNVELGNQIKWRHLQTLKFDNLEQS